VHDITTGSYQGNFYIPFKKREKVSDFVIVGNSLIIIYKNYLATYQLPVAIEM